MKSYHILVTGQVQGVSFRRFTLETAQQLGLTGWVRNLADGRVEALAQGEPAALEQWLEAVAQGPSRAKVDALDARVLPEMPQDGFAMSPNA